MKPHQPLPLGQSIENPARTATLAGGVAASTDSDDETDEEAIDPKQTQTSKEKR